MGQISSIYIREESFPLMRGKGFDGTVAVKQLA